ncbi:Quinone oxidoreductase-like protein 2-like protein [Diplonema papillatum]|nr:Quinone oxidoreductase-like protein 2-like protein [Diplonema papillatum]
MALPKTMRAAIADSGKLAIVERPVPKPCGSEVLVKIHSTAINRADTLQRQGKYPVPPGVTDILGLEMSGTVVQTAEKSLKNWKEGDKVMGLLGGGGYAEYTAIDESLLMPIPEGFDLNQAAGVPETWLTAFQLLSLVGHVQPNETVVVHAAGSGVGTAATQLATKVFGAKVAATAGTDEKLGVAKSLGATWTANYKQQSWSETFKELNVRADLILDPVGGSYIMQNLESLNMDGRVVLYGLMGGATAEGPVLAHLLRKRASIQATTLRSRSLPYRADLVQRFAEQALPMLSSGELRVIFDKRSFTLDQVQEAHEYMETNGNIGKVIVKVA